MKSVYAVASSSGELDSDLFFADHASAQAVTNYNEQGEKVVRVVVWPSFDAWILSNTLANLDDEQKRVLKIKADLSVGA